jgi:hypothetical protein
MLTIGNRTGDLDMNLGLFGIIKNYIQIDTKNLSLIENEEIKDKRLSHFREMIELLSQDKFNLFYQSLDEEQKNFLNQNEYYRFLSSTINYQSVSQINSSQSSYLALKSRNVSQLIVDDNFVAQFPFNNIIDILLFQSILMHNSQEVDAIRGLSDLTDEQDNKRQQVLKNIAIASLVNENLHEKSLDILKNIPPQNFTEEDKKIVQLSIDFLSASIILASNENKDEEAISQFNLLEKVLKVYGDKFEEHNITLQMPENIAKALEEKKKFEIGYLPKDNKEEFSPKVFGEISPEAPNLTRDHLQLISNKVILSALKERPSAMVAQGQGGSAISTRVHEAR